MRQQRLEKTFLILNDVLICRIGTLGKAIRIDTDIEFSIFVSLGLIKLINVNLADYIVIVINSGYGFINGLMIIRLVVEHIQIR